MPITGMWQDAVAIESGALKWGGGVNPIHGISGSPYGGRSDTPIHTATGPDSGYATYMPDELLDPGLASEFGYTDEEFAGAGWGYGPDTGTSDRPSVGTTTEAFRGHTNDNWPGATTPSPSGRPLGSFIRAEPHGIRASKAKLGDKEETVGEGWKNKEVGAVEDSGISDESQYVVATSMIQRDKVRRGSQNPNTGTASEHVAPVASFRPTWGQRVKPWSGGRRHYDMAPREQNERIRPFWYRSAGTGYVEYMRDNEATQYQREALQRQPVPDPYAGQAIPAPGNVYQEESYPVQDYVNVWY